MQSFHKTNKRMSFFHKFWSDSRKEELVVTWIIAIFAVLFIIFGLTTWFRKKSYAEIDRLDSLKMELMSRPITEEIAKIKALNVKGKTEENFEKWRSEWDDIITVHMPEIEEQIFDAEQAVDKYRFTKVKQKLKDTEERLLHTEEQMNNIIKEVQELLQHKEDNEKDCQEVETLLANTRRTMLAHHLSFGETVTYFEEEHQRLKEQYESYQQFIDEGDYYQAREVLVEVKEKLVEMDEKMGEVPQLLSELKHNIPNALDELERGQKEMEEDGYDLTYLSIQKQIDLLRKELPNMYEKMIKVQIDDVKHSLEDTNQKIDDMYDQLQKEVIARQFVKVESAHYEEWLKRTTEKIQKLEKEALDLQETYHLMDSDVVNEHYFKRELSQATKKYNLVADTLTKEKQSFVLLEQTLKEVEEKLKAVDQAYEEYIETLQSLRKDEYEAKQKLKAMRHQVLEMSRKVQIHHLPGVTSEYKVLMERTKGKLEKCKNQLEEKPLQMDVINRLLKEAEEMVNDLQTQTNKMIEQVQLFERLIQYGNRYRRKSKELSRQLDEAEQAFRECKYEQALEKAAMSIERVSPGSIQQLELPVKK